MYGIYEAVWNASWRIDDLRIKDSVYSAARDGDITSQNHIMTLYKSKLRKKFGRSPGYIHWDDWHFDIKRVRDAEAPKSRTRTTPRSTQSLDRCDCECVQCDIGYHCHNPRRDCNLRP